MITEVSNFLLRQFFPDVITKFFDIAGAPFKQPEMFWILVPVMAVWIIIELYFARYIREEMEYHTALDNSLFLLFVGVDLVRRLWTESILFSDFLRTGIAFFIVLLALLMAYFDFFHVLKRKLVFRFSSKFVISFIAYTSIILIYSNILSEHTTYNYVVTLIGVLIFYTFLRLFAHGIRIFGPKKIDEVDDMLRDVGKELSNAAHELKKKKD